MKVGHVPGPPALDAPAYQGISLGLFHHGNDLAVAPILISPVRPPVKTRREGYPGVAYLRIYCYHIQSFEGEQALLAASVIVYFSKLTDFWYSPLIKPSISVYGRLFLFLVCSVA